MAEACRRRLDAIRQERARLAEEEAALLAEMSALDGGGNGDGDSECVCENTAPRAMDAWEMSAGTTAELLSELGLAPLYGATFDEYEVHRIDQLVRLGRPGLRELLTELGVTYDHRDKIEALAFSPRPVGASGRALSSRFLSSVRAANASHMGCENMGPLLYALARFVKPTSILEVGAGYTSLWLLQARHLHSRPVVREWRAILSQIRLSRRSRRVRRSPTMRASSLAAPPPSTPTATASAAPSGS